MMRIVADFHVHSRYARGTSPKCDIDGLSLGAKMKGIDVIATGDFTHPSYFEEIKTKLQEDGSGLYGRNGVKFILSTEISLIYKQGDRTRKMHHIVLSPSIEVASQIIDSLSKVGNLKSDGRPILGLSSPAFADILFSISKDIMIIPAHAWTPWFSVFGSKSGVDSIEEAFDEHAKRIYAIETGLSSDPQMNWLVSRLDRYTLVSNSDAHSIEKLGREANVLNLDRIDYRSITEAIKTRKGFEKTYEFYPEEGKYHYDGHRNCGVQMSPWESKSRNDICPVCRKKLTVGVLHRVADLADRPQGYRPENAIPFDYVIPLTTLISKTIKKGENTQAVTGEYSKLIRYFGSEFAVYEAPPEQIELATTPEISRSINRARTGKVRWVPGYDGVFGDLVLDDKPSRKSVDKMQKSLEEF